MLLHSQDCLRSGYTLWVSGESVYCWKAASYLHLLASLLAIKTLNSILNSDVNALISSPNRRLDKFLDAQNLFQKSRMLAATFAHLSYTELPHVSSNERAIIDFSFQQSINHYRLVFGSKHERLCRSNSGFMPWKCFVSASLPNTLSHRLWEVHRSRSKLGIWLSISKRLSDKLSGALDCQQIDSQFNL